MQLVGNTDIVSISYVLKCIDSGRILTNYLHTIFRSNINYYLGAYVQILEKGNIYMECYNMIIKAAPSYAEQYHCDS